MTGLEIFGVQLYFYIESQIHRVWKILDIGKLGVVSEEQYVQALKKLDASWSRDINEVVAWETEWRSVMKLMHDRTEGKSTNDTCATMVTFEEFFGSIMELADKLGKTTLSVASIDGFAFWKGKKYILCQCRLLEQRLIGYL